MIGSVLRRKAFWMIDYIKKGTKKKEYDNIKELNNDEKILSHQKVKLEQLLTYVQEQVPYYKKFSSLNIEDYPVMNKLDYKNGGLDNFISDEYKDKQLHHVCTSGSTGNPFDVYQNKSKRNRVVCDLIYCHENIGWNLGDKYVFIRNWVSNYNNSKLKAYMQNVKNINVTEFDDSCKKKLVKYLKNNKNVIIFGYASAILDFSKYVTENNIDGTSLSIKLIVCDSDELTPHNRKVLEKVFNTAVYNRYDNEENGLLGISKNNDDRIYLNTKSLYFELLKLDSDKKAEPGEIGRVVVTDLYNYAMPLIRYDLGDLAISNNNPEELLFLEQFSGRTAGSIMNTNGARVSNVTFSGAIEPYTGIVRYQIIQKSVNEYTFKYVGEISDDEEKSLKDRLHKCLGEDGDINILVVDKIDVEKNGKYKVTKRLF